MTNIVSDKQLLYEKRLRKLGNRSLDYLIAIQEALIFAEDRKLEKDKNNGFYQGDTSVRRMDKI
ncbi:hypothetical protein FACS1894120_5910 [Clostridia bacterium]|nr:hypothetical protein FACS1894120_5910 [Clostridia bacterium]